MSNREQLSPDALFSVGEVAIMARPYVLHHAAGVEVEIVNLPSMQHTDLGLMVVYKVSWGGKFYWAAESQLSKKRNAEEELVKRVCQYLKDEIAMREPQLETCRGCPLTIDTPYGKGVSGCVLRAQQLIQLVRYGNYDRS